MKLERRAGAYWEDEIIRCIESYPPPSSLGWELYQYLNSSGSNIEEAMRIVAQDPVFAAEVIRHACSAQFGCREVASLREAAVAIGYRQLARIALTYFYRNLAPDRFAVYNEDAARFYKKSLACALAMEYLSGPEADLGGDWYTLGLLHAIGEIFIDAAISWREDQPIRLIADTPFKLAQIEESFLGTNQARVAGVALRAWHFPECIVAPIEQQFCSKPGSRYFEVTQSLAVSRYIARKLVDSDGDGERSMGGKDHVIFRRRLLSEVYDHVSKRCDAMASLCVA